MTALRALPVPARRRRVSAATPGRVVQVVLLTLLALFCVVPFAWLVLASLDARAGATLQVPILTLQHYVEVFTTGLTLRLLLNSLLIAGASTVLTLALGLLGGYALSRYRFVGRRPFMFGILLIRVVPPTATIVPLYLLLVRMGLDNSYLGLILVETAGALPLALWQMKAAVDAIPLELEEAAWVDGQDRFGSIRSIVLPLVRPAFGAAAMFAFLAVWGDFLTPLVLLQSQELYPISIGLFRAFSAFNQVDWGLLTATAIVYMAPPTVLYLVVRRYLFRGALAGAVKG